jgi:seryl-tRNA synthetase
MKQADIIIRKIVEMDEYMREQLATKDELRELRNEMIMHMDGFASRQDKFEVELVALRHHVDRLETSMGRP